MWDTNVFLWGQLRPDPKRQDPSVPPQKKKWDPLHTPKGFDLERRNFV